MRLALLLGAALLAAGPALHAQSGDKAAKKPQPSAREVQAKAARTCEAIKRRAPADPMKGDPGKTEAAPEVVSECAEKIEEAQLAAS